MLDQLNHKSYLKNEMIDELDLVTGNQLKDCTISFHQKKKEIGLQFPKCFLVS